MRFESRSKYALRSDRGATGTLILLPQPRFSQKFGYAFSKSSTAQVNLCKPQVSTAQFSCMYRTSHKCTVRLARHSLVSSSQVWVSGKAQINDGVRLDRRLIWYATLAHLISLGSLWNTGQDGSRRLALRIRSQGFGKAAQHSTQRARHLDHRSKIIYLAFRFRWADVKYRNRAHEEVTSAMWPSKKSNLGPGSTESILLNNHPQRG